VSSAILVKLSSKWNAINRESAARMGESVVAIIAARDMMNRMLGPASAWDVTKQCGSQNLQVPSPYWPIQRTVAKMMIRTDSCLYYTSHLVSCFATHSFGSLLGCGTRRISPVLSYLRLGSLSAGLVILVAVSSRMVTVPVWMK